MEKLFVKDLNDYDKNPRYVKDGHHEMLSSSIEYFGDISGIVYNVRTKRLIGGHQRKISFSDNFPIIITQTYQHPTKTGTVREGYVDVNGERFNYREVDWDEDKELAANIAANKGAGQFDYSLLQQHILYLDSVNFDLSKTMHDSDELETMMGNWKDDLESIDKIEETAEGLPAKIIITCPQDLKDEVLIYLKAKLLETSFEGVHVE